MFLVAGRGMMTWLQEGTKQLGVELTDSQLCQFEQYYRLLVETNKVMNLTAITEPKEVAIKHFYDSLTLARVLPFIGVNTLLDVGTGAGFPGIPLKIAFPHLKVVLLDSLKKRIGFLENVVKELGLTNVTCIHGRAEDWGRHPDMREKFDVVTARAVARLNVLAEYCLPFVKVGGVFVAMKGAQAEEEAAEAKRALSVLGKAALEVVSLELPDEMGTRHLLVVKKRERTPKSYPRKAGTPAKQPLV
jgi:16S rRNA (guanine527-N7)-methyltransferase